MPEWNVDDRSEWTLEQIRKAQLPDSVAGPVQALLAVWWKMHHDPENVEKILYTFTELVQEHALEVPDDDFTWVAVKPGQIRVAEIVRVKLNAYPGEVGKRHNGRISRVVAIRSGDIITNTIDEGPKIEGSHHSPYALEKKVPRVAAP